MITKLLNKILLLNINENDWYSEDNIIDYSYCRSDNEWITSKINVHEFANKCKIWAFSRGYELISGAIYEDNGDMIFECSIYDNRADNAENYFIMEFEDNNEPWVIFKACEWILEQIEKEMI